MRAIWSKIAPYKYWLGAVVVLLIAFKANAYYTTSKKPQTVTGQIVTVERGDITSEVSATGTIKPVNMVDVSSKITGLIKEVKVQENQPVKAGDVIMMLDDTHLSAQVAQSQSRLANATANYERLQRLTEIGAVSKQQLDAAQMDYNVAKAAYDDAVSQLNDTVIKAPIDGTIIGKPIPAGQTVSPGISSPMILATVADMSLMQIETQVDESDIGKVQVGNKVNFTVDAYPGKTFTGTVANISQRANVQQNVVYYSVLVNVNSTDNLLKPSMTARVSIVTGEHPNTLIIPLSAVRMNKNQQYVQVLQAGKNQNADITTGISGEDKIEVLSGLEQGEQIVIPQPKAQSQPAGGGGGQRSMFGGMMGR